MPPAQGDGLPHTDQELPGLTGRKRKENGACALVTRFLRENALILLTLLGIAIGFAVGVGLQSVKASSDVLQWIGVPGEIFLRSLKATIVPIIVCMVITATASLDPTMNRRVAFVGVASFFITSVFAVITAIVLFLILKPGVNSISSSSEDVYSNNLQTQDIFLDLIRNIFTDNVVDSTISQTTTKYTEKEAKPTNASVNATDPEVTYEKSLTQTRGINILGLITACVAVGAAANNILPRESAFLSFFRQGQQVVMKIMTWITWMTPVGVASLVAQSIADVSDLGSIFLSIGRLVLCVAIGLVFHHFVTLPAFYALLCRKNPFKFLIRCTKTYFVAFAATATSVALPHMLDACKQNGVKKQVARFVIPMSVTLHADGSGLYIASASLFVAQTSGEESLGAANILVIGALSSILSMTIPPVPSASIVTVAVVLTSINRPLHGIALLFTVEWLLDRLRSGVNGVSHVICAAYTDAICNGRIQPEVAGSEETGHDAREDTNSLDIGITGDSDALPRPRTDGYEVISLKDKISHTPVEPV